MELVTKRLLLREFLESDWVAVHKYATDPEVVRYTTFGPNTEEETRRFVQRQISKQSNDPRRDFGLAITLKKNGLLIGSCGIHVEPQDRGGEIGFCLSREYWGQGYGTEAAEALLRFGFGQLGLHRILGTCDPENLASKRVLEKVGMVREGLVRQHLMVKGRWVDSLLYAILENEFDGSERSG